MTHPPSDVTGLDAPLDRLLDRIPLSPFWVASLGSAALLAVFVGLAAATGDLARLLAGEGNWWQNRDARLAVLLSLLLAYLPLARRALRRGSRANLEALRTSAAFPPGRLDAALRARFVLYLALPLGSWLGGALVERVVDTLLA